MLFRSALVRINAVKSLKITSDSVASARVVKARGLLEQMANLFTDAGVPVKPYTSPDLPVFQTHSPESQDELIRELEARVELFASAAAENIDLRDSRQLLWRSLRRGGWTPNSDVFDMIDDEDTVEVYSLEMKQIFRNLTFFKWISYTLEEMHGGAWHELTTRNEDVQTKLMAAAMSLVNGETKETVNLSFIPNHECSEVKSVEKRKFMIQMKAISPVFRDGKLVAFIAVNRTRSCE